MKRRSLLKNFVFFWVQSHFFLQQALAKPTGEAWVQSINSLSLDLKNKKIKPLDWYHGVEKIYKAVSVEEILKFSRITPVEIDELIDQNSKKPTVYKLNEKFGYLDGIKLIPRIMYLRTGVSNTPHAHIDMVSCHYVIEGELLLKCYDRVKIENDKIHLRQTDERIVKSGDVIAMCEEKNNIHWFKALKNSATFNIPVCNLGLSKIENPNTVTIADHKLLFMDPDKSPKVNGIIISSLISAEDSAKRFNI